MASRSGLIAGLIAAMLAALLCPVVCAQLRIMPAQEPAPATQSACHQKSIPAGDPASHPDQDSRPFHSCERCTHLQQAVKNGTWTPVMNSVSLLPGFLDPVLRLFACQPVEFEPPAQPRASSPGIGPILRI
jgi:hypothetical protein